jgi:hypothetical protein
MIQEKIRQLKEILANNKDGHLDLHECMVIRETIELLEELLKRR